MIMEAIERWDLRSEPVLKGRKKKRVEPRPLAKEDKEYIRWLFQKYAFTLEWNEGGNRISIVVHDKVHTTPVPPRVPSALDRIHNDIRARLNKLNKK